MTTPISDETPSYSIADFIQKTGERDQPGDVFELESHKMLEIHVNGRVWTKLGAAIAYRGDLKFIREGVMEGGLGKALKKMVSGEVTPLSKVEGQGRLYVADSGKYVSILRLAGDTINVSGNDLLAFEDTVSYDITMIRRVAGMMAGGLFSVKLTGHGMVALTTHGDPLTLRVTPNDPVSTDPNATVAWSGSLSPELKTDISFKSLLGRGGGETFQMLFRGDGFVVVQPYEEKPVVEASSGG
ncbi:MAG: AIM24 family protein [Cytophagales bacterium]|nr:AIM24 family protein [Armatimonadota bacterium]